MDKKKLKIKLSYGYSSDKDLDIEVGVAEDVADIITERILETLAVAAKTSTMPPTNNSKD